MMTKTYAYRCMLDVGYVIFLKGTVRKYDTLVLCNVYAFAFASNYNLGPGFSSLVLKLTLLHAIIESFIYISG